MFDARVEPFGALQEQLKERFSLFALMREKKRFQKFVQEMNERLRPMTGSPATLRHDQPGACVCNLKIARANLPLPLKAAGAAKGSFPHLAGIPDAGSALYLPVDFPEPFTARKEAAASDIVIGSAVRLQAELAALNKFLRVEQTFALTKMVDFLAADEKAIAVYERKMGASGDFWIKFAYVVLKKLADMSGGHRFPVVFLPADGGTVP